MDLPVVALTRAVHIGTLDPDDKGLRGASYEGHGLSVSVDPDDWLRIAKLGGLPWWELRNAAGRFMDRHALTGAQRDQISAWAVDAGLARRRELWRVTYHDDELDGDVSVLFDSREAAEVELDDLDDGEAQPVMALTATAALAARVGRADGDCFDLAAVCFTEDITDVDGVWWADRRGPFSAPRGVILPGRLHRWTACRLRGDGGGASPPVP